MAALFFKKGIGSTNNQKRGTTAHEIGHLLWLGDDPPVSYSESLMRADRTRQNTYSPQTYDENNVRFRYE